MGESSLGRRQFGLRQLAISLALLAFALALPRWVILAFGGQADEAFLIAFTCSATCTLAATGLLFHHGLKMAMLGLAFGPLIGSFLLLFIKSF